MIPDLSVQEVQQLRSILERLSTKPGVGLPANTSGPARVGKSKAGAKPSKEMLMQQNRIALAKCLGPKFLGFL